MHRCGLQVGARGICVRDDGWLAAVRVDVVDMARRRRDGQCGGTSWGACSRMTVLKRGPWLTRLLSENGIVA